MNDWMTIEDLVEYLQVDKSTIEDFMDNLGIPFHEKLGSPRFFKPEIDDWMRSDMPGQKQLNQPEEDFVYRGKPIKSYMLTASKVLIGPTAWRRFPGFIDDSVKLFNQTDRSHLLRKEFQPLIGNFNDYLRVCCQLGLIDNIRDGRTTNYTPTDYASKILEESDSNKKKKIILDCILDIIKENRESIPQERHSIYLVWYTLQLNTKMIRYGEDHYAKEGEINDYPRIRYNFSRSLVDFLFNKDFRKETEFLSEWNRFI